MKEDNSNKLMQEYLEISEAIKMLTKKKDKIKAEIKGMMGDTLYLQSGNLAAVIIPSIRKTLNSELIEQELEAEGKKIPDYWWKETPSDRFMVKEVIPKRKDENSD